MNCKPGDLAIIINHVNEGRIVTCIRLAKQGDRLHAKCGMPLDFISEGKPVWFIEGYAEHTSDNVGIVDVPLISDANVKPLRPSTRQDETLTWAGKPEQVAS